MDFQLIVFDLDGTLTDSKQPLAPKISELLKSLLARVPVAVIGGGSFLSFRRQLLAPLNASDGELSRLFLFSTNGAGFFRFQNGHWQVVYLERLTAAEKRKIFSAFEQILPAAGFKSSLPLNKLIEDRGSQITFSALGQNAPLDKKLIWDSDRFKRKQIKSALTPLLPDFNISIAGTTSIDVTRRGLNKSYGLKQMEHHLNIPLSQMLFIGDALYSGGNDEPVLSSGVSTRRVSGPSETEKIIRELISTPILNT